jgi:hypothetical protein
LIDNAKAFSHFLDPEEITVIAVSVPAKRNSELYFGIYFVGDAFPNISVDSRSSKHHSAKTSVQGFLFGNNSDVP